MRSIPNQLATSALTTTKMLITYNSMTITFPSYSIKVNTIIHKNIYLNG